MFPGCKGCGESEFSYYAWNNSQKDPNPNMPIFIVKFKNCHS